MIDEQEEQVDMSCSVCTNEQKINNCVTLKQLLGYGGGILVFLLFILNLILSPIQSDIKRNELRASRLESSIISSESKLNGIDKKIDNFVSELKYVYPTKEYVDKELKKKVDLERIDKRNLKN